MAFPVKRLRPPSFECPSSLLEPLFVSVIPFYSGSTHISFVGRCTP